MVIIEYKALWIGFDWIRCFEEVILGDGICVSENVLGALNEILELSTII